MKISIKKYWKIIVTALLSIVVILFVSYGNMMSKVAYTTRSTSAQRSKIVENVDACIRFYENRREIANRTRLDIVNKLSAVIYDHESNYDDKLMNEYFSDAGIKDIMILDSKRNITSIHGCKDYKLSKAHFHDPYYDAVFDDAETRSADRINIAELKDYGKDALFIKVKAGYWVYIYPELEGEDDKDMHYFWKSALANTWVGELSGIGVMDSNTGEIIYCENAALEGKLLDIHKKDSYWGQIDDDLYQITLYPIEKLSVNVVALTPVIDVMEGIKGQLIESAVLILLAFIIMIALIVFLREDEIDAAEEISWGGKYFLKNQLKKYVYVGAAVSIILAGSLILVSELDYMTGVEESMNYQIDNTVALFDDYYEDGIVIENMVEGRFYEYGRIADTFLKNHPNYVTKKGLSYLADLFGVSDVTVFDSDGKTVSTSSPLDHLEILSDEESSLYDLRYALMGKEEVSVSADARILSKDMRYFAIPRRNEQGIAEGIIAVEVSPEKIERFVPRGILNDRSGITQFCADEDGEILLFHDPKLIGKNVSSIGISTDMIYDGYTGKFEYNHKDYAAQVKSSKAGYTILVCQYDPFTASVVGNGLLSTLLFMIAAAFFAYDGLGSKYRFASRPRKKKGAESGVSEIGNGSALTVGAKMGRVINVVVYCLSAYFIIGQWMIYSGIGTHTTINYIFNGDWDRSVNLFSIVCNLYTIMVYYSVVRWFSAILSRVAEISGQTGETISRLIANIIKYLGAIACMYQAAMNFGVDAKTALGSIGIVGFGLTFGAQDMIKDIISGIFIFFEGSYKVGDTLLIGGDRFCVKSIGIRTTRVEAEGKVRLINNSSLEDVVNLKDH